jgi:hypothetical protein
MLVGLILDFVVILHHRNLVYFPDPPNGVETRELNVLCVYLILN